MNWEQIRQTYPNRWLIVEALEAHSTLNQRVLDQLVVVEECVDGTEAFQRYQVLHTQSPAREWYFVHTAREQLQVHERQWLGIRRGDAAHA